MLASLIPFLAKPNNLRLCHSEMNVNNLNSIIQEFRIYHPNVKQYVFNSVNDRYQETSRIFSIEENIKGLHELPYFNYNYGSSMILSFLF